MNWADPLGIMDDGGDSQPATPNYLDQYKKALAENNAEVNKLLKEYKPSDDTKQEISLAKRSAQARASQMGIVGSPDEIEPLSARILNINNSAKQQYVSNAMGMGSAMGNLTMSSELARMQAGASQSSADAGLMGEGLGAAAGIAAAIII